MNTLGLDIGGAGIKAADATGRAINIPFPLWKQPSELASMLADVVSRFAFDKIAVTMTGELCDCFETKSHGVRFILDALRSAVNPDTPLLLWTNQGEFISPAKATENPWLVASANWLAIASAAATLTENSPALLVDVGSTTTDIIRIEHSTPQPIGRTDPERLISGELVYVGATRTPVCSLLSSFDYFGRHYGIMKEFFATTLDAFLLTGEIDPNPDSTSTADGRPASTTWAIDRLARMIGCDRSVFNEAAALEMAKQIRAAVIAQITSGLQKVMAGHSKKRVDRVLISGQGEFLAAAAIEQCEPTKSCPINRLSECWSDEASSAACAHSLAQLMSE